MSFDERDIRRTMDVYTRDNSYLGTVLGVTPGPPLPPRPGQPAAPVEGSAVSGELLGPMPTQPLGNTGPAVQSFNAGYAAAPDEASSLGQGTITVGKWWGLGGRHTFPIDAVQSVSLERVVLRMGKDELTG